MTQEQKPDDVVTIGDVNISNAAPFALFAGPCQMESRDHGLEMDHGLKEICDRLGIGLIFKASFDKANRTSIGSQRGLGFEGTLPVFAEIREKYGLAIVTDVHEAAHCAPAAEVVDVLQIPAFLCRQTDLLVAAAKPEQSSRSKRGNFWPRGI